jgi:hypothetical protein
MVRAARSVTQCIAGQTIIVPVRDGVADLEALFTLNVVGARVWELLDRPVTCSRLAGMIAEDYDVTVDEAAHDVMTFVEALRAAGLIEPAVEGAPDAAPAVLPARPRA